jgi:hypothetical protein
MSLISLENKVNKLLAAQDMNDWIPESKGFLDLEAETLRKMRNDPTHNSGWKCRKPGKVVDTKNRIVRRGVIWSKTYLMSLYVQP